MEELLKLLNEHEKKRIEAVNAKGLPYNIKLSFRPYTEEHLTNKAYKDCQLEICSKHYGFIKLLCDKDKIDLWKLPKEFENIHGFGLPNRIVMILSIQDKPIEFLINILK